MANCCCDTDPNCLACSRAQYIQALINYSKTVQMPYSCPAPCCPPPPTCPPQYCPASTSCYPSLGSTPPTKLVCCYPTPCGSSPCSPPALPPCPPPALPPCPPPCPPCESFWRKLLRAIFKFIADILWLLHLILMFLLRRIENMYNFYYAFIEANIFLQIAFVLSLSAFITSMIINYRAHAPCPLPIIIERCPAAK